MKIEKLTDNKIRVIINSYDLEKDNLNINKLSILPLEKQTIFTNIIEKAKKEVDFEVNDCKLIIESFITDDEFLVFTITKYPIQEKKKPIIKRKQLHISSNIAIYKFETMNNFIDFCK